MTRWRRPLVAELALYVLTAVVSSAAAVAALELWRADLAAPFTYSGDALAIAAHVKTVIETGWYESQPLLGAPAGQVYHDFPTADNLNFALLGLIGLFAHDWALTMNLYYVIGFPLAAVTAVAALRDIGVSRAMSGSLAVVYSLATYHFIRGEAHLFLASYFVVPLAVLLVVRVLQGRRIWGRRHGATGWRAVVLGPGAGTVVIAAVVGTAQSYYAVYFLLLLAVAGLASLILRRDWRRFWGAAGAGVLTVGVMLANMLPDLVYRLQHGPNPTGFERGHSETEIYGFKLAQLLLPWGGHRIEPLGQLRRLYDASYPLPSEHPVLGAIAAAGFVALMIGVVVAAVSAGRGNPVPSPTRALLGGLGALALVIFLFATTGGLATFVSFVTTSLRGGNRISIYLMLICLMAVGLLGDAALRRLATRLPSRPTVPRLASAAVAALLVVAGFVDQTPGDSSAGYDATAERFRADAEWFAEVEHAVGDGALVLQLPYQPYPEELGPTGVLSSETLVPYLHTRAVRWSGGGIQGRPEYDWPGMLEQFEPAEIATLAAAAGADAILVDRRALFAESADTLDDGRRRRDGWPPPRERGRALRPLPARRGAGEPRTDRRPRRPRPRCPRRARSRRARRDGRILAHVVG